MKHDNKNAPAGKARAILKRSELETDTQLSYLNSIITSQPPTLQISSVLPPNTAGGRVIGRALQKGEDEPDFSAFPWPGMMRVIYWSYRMNLPSLRNWTLDSIKQTAIEDELNGGYYE